MKRLHTLILCSALSLTAYGETQNIDLDKSYIYLTTGFLTEMRNVSASPKVITKKEIEEKHYNNVLDVLESVSAVSVTKGMDGMPNIDLRGQGATIAKRNVQLLIDGVAINSLDTSHGSNIINSISVDSIERIEIIPGGGSVLYGSGSQGGVVNIMTKSGRGHGGSIGYERSSYQGNDYKVNYYETIGQFDFDLAYNQKNSYGYRAKEKNDSDFFLGNITYNIDENNKVNFKYSYYDGDQFKSEFLSKKELNEDRRGFFIDKKYRKLQTKRESYDVNFYSKLNDKLELDTTIFYSNFDSHKYTLNEEIAPSLFDDKKIGIKPKFKYSYGEGEFNGSSVVFGVDYIDNNLKSSTDKNKNNFTKKTFAAFVMNNLRYNSFEFNQGFRYEKSKYDLERNLINKKTKNIDKTINKKRDMENIAYELSGSYLYSDTGKIYLRLEEGFTTPPPALLTNKLTVDKKKYYFLNDLKAEKYTNLEFGASDYLFNNTVVSGNVFYTLTDDEIYTSKGGKYWDRILNYNIDKTKRYGAELALEHYFGKLTLTESYHYIIAKIDKGTEKKYEQVNRKYQVVDGADLKGRYIHGVPKHKVVLSAKYDFTDRFSINSEFVYNAKTYIENTNKKGQMKSTSIVNLAANYDFQNGLNIYGGINNLFNEKYCDAVYYETFKGKNTVSFSPADERNFFAGFRYTF